MSKKILLAIVWGFTKRYITHEGPSSFFRVNNRMSDCTFTQDEA